SRGAERVRWSRYPLNWEAIMRFKITGILLLSAVSFTNSAAAQTTPAPSAITRTVIAATKLPTVTDVPLYFRAVGVTLPPGEKSSVSAANGILYQMSGSTEVSIGGEAKVLNAEGGKRSAFNLPPLLPCPGCGPQSARRDGACRREGTIPNGGTDSRPEAGR